MADGTTYELYESRQGETGLAHQRSRIFLINWPVHQAIIGGQLLGTIPFLGDPFIFDTGTLYCGSNQVETTSHPDWTVVKSQFVRVGELRYSKLPGEPGFRHLATTSGAGDVTVPYIQEVASATPGVFDYVTNNVNFKRRDSVALVTVNVLTDAYDEVAMGQLKSVLNKYIDDKDVEAGEGPWLFETFTTTELSDRVTQVVCSFRSSSTLEARTAAESGGAFDVDLPALGPFERYITKVGPTEDMGGSIGVVRTAPTVLVTSDYTEATSLPEIFGPTGFNILPIFQ